MAVGLLLGAASHLGDELHHSWAAIANIGGPWVASAFWAGSGARSATRGMLRGAGALVVALVAYYATKRLLDPGPIALDLLRRDGPYWLILAAVAGPLFGLLGARWRSGKGWRRSVPVALLGGALVAEGLRVPTLFFPGVATTVTATLEILAGLTAAWALGPRDLRARTLVVTLGAAAAAYLAMDRVREALGSFRFTP